MPNGYGTITKLTGKRRKPYMARLACTYTSDGDRLTERRPVLGYYRTRTEALQALAEYNKSPYDIGNNATFADVYSEWIKTKKVGKKAMSGYTNAFGKCKDLHDIPIAELRLQHYQGIINRYTHQSATSMKCLLAVIRGVSQYALKYEIISKDYSEFIESEYAEAGNIHKPFTESEIAALWAQKQSALRNITLILLYSGFRVNELLKMKADNIDLDSLTFTGGSKTKAGKDRIVPIHHRIIPLVTEYKSGFPIRYSHYYALLRETGHIPHDTRHTFVSRLQSVGADHLCIQRLVGHASDNVTDNVYTHKDLAELRKTIEMLK